MNAEFTKKIHGCFVFYDANSLEMTGCEIKMMKIKSSQSFIWKFMNVKCRWTFEQSELWIVNCECIEFWSFEFCFILFYHKLISTIFNLWTMYSVQCTIIRERRAEFATSCFPACTLLQTFTAGVETKSFCLKHWISPYDCILCAVTKF